VAFSGRKILAGLAWSAVGLYTIRVLGLVTTLVLAKVLVPADFGLVAVASMLIAILHIFKDMGLGEALIYHKMDSERALDTAHTLLVGFYTVLFLVAVVVAPFVARLYDTPAVIPVIILMSSTLILDATRAVPRAVFRKELKFRSLFLPEVVPVAVACVVSVWMALTGWGVWSLVVRTVLHSLLGMIFLGYVTPYRPRLRFDPAIARQLLHYGKFIIGSSLLFVAVYNIDKFYVSKLDSLAALGLYELAVRISDLPVREFSFVIGSVMFPVLTKAGAGAALRNAFLGALKYTAFVSFPMAIGISLYGGVMIDAVYGPAWAGMIAPLQVLAIYALFRSLSSIIHDGFKATGKPVLMQKAVFVKLMLIGVLGVPVLMRYGMVGMAVLIVLTYAAVFVGELVVISRLMETPVRTTARPLLAPLICSLTVLPAIRLALAYLRPSPTLWEAAAAIVLTVPAYLLLIYLVDKRTVSEVRRLVSRPSSGVREPQAAKA
jgi:O-antigen/teichoic acid export membrane protein